MGKYAGSQLHRARLLVPYTASSASPATLKAPGTPQTIVARQKTAEDRCAKLGHGSKELTYQEIASALQVQVAEVETWVISTKY